MNKKILKVALIVLVLFLGVLIGCNEGCDQDGDCYSDPIVTNKKLGCSRTLCKVHVAWGEGRYATCDYCTVQ